MEILLLTSLSSQRDAPPEDSEAHAPRLDPAEETDDGPRQVPDFPRPSPGFTVAGTAPDFRRLPFEPPPPDMKSVGGTLIVGCCYGGNRRAVKLLGQGLFEGP